MAVDPSSRDERTAGRRRGVVAYSKACITHRRQVTDDLYVVRFKTAEPFTFKPGQYCTVSVDDIERPYSIVSAPEEDEIELFIELVPPPTGVLTPILCKLSEGDALQVRPRAKGIFTFDSTFKNHLMVSTVTGAAPYVSMLRHLIREGAVSQWNIHVLQGASYQDEFTYDAEFRALAAQYPNITYLPTVSRPQDPRNRDWTGQTGRVNLIVEEYALKNGLSTEDTLVYACGHPGMIDDVRERMTARGYNVKDERFWKEDEEPAEPVPSKSHG